MTGDEVCVCGHVVDEHGYLGMCEGMVQAPAEVGVPDIPCPCECFDEDVAEVAAPEDETMIDLGGGMVVPLAELLEDDDA